ncbi:hypothetical protein NW759_016949 [Fusarium solani]|nr:hypothetical protein NW759_016949 [Fusarium solani]
MRSNFAVKASCDANMSRNCSSSSEGRTLQPATQEDQSLDESNRQDGNLEGGPEPEATNCQQVSSSSDEKVSGNSGETGPSSLDDNIVWWDSDTDLNNPYNWPKWRKLSNCGLISKLTLVEPLASSIFAPGIPDLMKDFGSDNQELSSFVVSVYVLGFTFGPMALTPLSEMLGRLPVYHVCNVIFLGFTVVCAKAPSLTSLIIFWFFAGAFGAAPMANEGGSIADMYIAEERAGVMAVFSVGPLIGPIIGPVIGGFLTQAKGWRWDFWVIVIVAGAISGAMLLVLRESYAPVLLERKASRLRKETGNSLFRSRLDTGLSTKDLFKQCIIRPVKLLVFSPICTIFAVYLALVYGYIYILFTSVPYVFEDTYGFSTKMVGLVYLGLGIGGFIDMAWFAVDGNNEVKKQLAAKNFKPEARLKLLSHAAIIFPAGFFIYGWTAEYKTHWPQSLVWPSLALVSCPLLSAGCNAP